MRLALRMWLKEDGQGTTNVNNSYLELFLSYAINGLMKVFISSIQMDNAIWCTLSNFTQNSASSPESAGFP